MKILYSGVKQYPNSNEFSFEHVNFYLSLYALKNHSVSYLPLDEMYQKGYETMSQKIKTEVLNQKPDVYLLNINDKLDKNVFSFLKSNSRTVIIGISTDDDTDFYYTTQFLGSHFDYFVNFYPPVVEGYQKRGVKIIGINYAANIDFFKPVPGISRDIPISFVGSFKSERGKIISQLLERGVQVSCFGKGWPNAPVSYDKMIRIFNRSQINLNFGQAKSIWRWQTPFRIFLSPAENQLGFKFDFKNWKGNLQTILNRRNPQSRARPYEITACGGFTITNRAAVFGEPFIENKEIVYFNSASDLIDKIRYYLSHDEERESIAEAGYRRTLKDHSFQKRFRDILSQITLKK